MPWVRSCSHGLDDAKPSEGFGEDLSWKRMVLQRWTQERGGPGLCSPRTLPAYPGAIQSPF